MPRQDLLIWVSRVRNPASDHARARRVRVMRSGPIVNSV
jgi:hypothetical protein